MVIFLHAQIYVKRDVHMMCNVTELSEKIMAKRNHENAPKTFKMNYEISLKTNVQCDKMMKNYKISSYKFMDFGHIEVVQNFMKNELTQVRSWMIKPVTSPCYKL